MATTEDTQASNSLSDRLRNGLALAQTRIQTMEERAKHQWTDLPAQLRTALDRAFARIRTTLDLPSRADMSDLMDRIEALDRKIGALEKGQGKRGGGKSRAGAEASADGASEGVTDAELEAAESTDTDVTAAAGNDVITDDSTSPASAASEGASKDTSRKTLQASKGTTAGKTLKASDTTTRPAKNGDNQSKSAKQHSKKHGGKGGKA